ncbi:hypothetical protein PHAMO_270257 [Magnetospirillum molischianum DSM 120]|uniref:Uncharacterized protein n=1 Tax=Magnetospirillum molischianum DSM 120 TaxID=1150626 RepID=H8FSS8_MAGML|nr:hypothetical protein PHAMO_270257 [Magnetospirillum molischianum DSM 120]
MTSPLRNAAPYGSTAHRLGDSAGRSPGLRVNAQSAQPSQFPSGYDGRGLAAHSCGDSLGLGSHANRTVFPLASPARTEEPACELHD